MIQFSASHRLRIYIFYSQDPTIGVRLRPPVRAHLLPTQPVRASHTAHPGLSSSACTHPSRALSYPKWNLQAVQSERLSPGPTPGPRCSAYSGPPGPRRPVGGVEAQLPSGPRIMSLRMARSVQAVACSLRTALASCPPRPWAPSAAAVRSLRTGSALLSGKCGARGHCSCPPRDVRRPHSQASRPERTLALPALLLTLGILVLRPFSLSRRERTQQTLNPG